ncbi:MAG: DUF1156 domain-containing protein [Magnetococcales bacterium]|nr:DUF1156 domain-containing protein [Magnetococcales bacterium]MBF0157336.1 DUF1156 domain-containing protein [Magnetococcales bacterium]
MTIESVFDISLIAAMALKEKQIQQNYRPIIAVHKWFARRPGTLFRGLLLAEFGNRPLSEAFFRFNDFPGRIVADPFMGGGTPLIEANRIGCDVIGCDVNPMAFWIVREEITHLDLPVYRTATQELMEALDQKVGSLYRTDCPLYGDKDMPVKYFLWVKVMACVECGHTIDLFPGYLLAENKRHPRNVLVCPQCGDLNERESLHYPGKCGGCGTALQTTGPAKRGQCTCPHCSRVNSYPNPNGVPPRHRLFAIEYHNLLRRNQHQGRFFKKPDAHDLEKVRMASFRWGDLTPGFVPDEAIPAGDETGRLHRWGYQYYRDMFNDRQLLGLELSCRHIAGVADDRVRRALSTNLSDLLRYQNMLCRYDTMALKSLDIFSVHGFPVGLVQCESNLLGIGGNGHGANVGSGGWANIVEKFSKAKRYCEAPFEVDHRNGRKVTIPIRGEWIGENRSGSHSRRVDLRQGSSTEMVIPPASLDAVFTDPPYFGNVQYGELMNFCHTWLRRLTDEGCAGFEPQSALSPHELTGNVSQGRGLEHFTEGLAAVYLRMAQALKPGAPLAFTYHHNRIEAYHAVGVAILDAGLTCTASLPCPAEMGGSIHIRGTGSSIVDTVFVCRAKGRDDPSMLFGEMDGLLPIVKQELHQLRRAGLKSSAGDVRCIVFGHLTRMAVWGLRHDWDTGLSTVEKLAILARTVAAFGDGQEVIDQAIADPPLPLHEEEPTEGLFARREANAVPL